MNIFQRSLQLFVSAVVASTLLAAPSYAQEFGQVVIKRGNVDDDLYLAGGQVDLYATVDGDAVVAGGQLHLEGDVAADVIAAGGKIDLRGRVGDDARIAGGDVRVSAAVGDDLIAAGGRIHLSPVSSIGGRAWLSGGEVRVDGQVAGQLRASGGRVVITGSVNGDVELWADEIIIDQAAVIAGKLHYRSANAASIADGARIGGGVVHTPVDVDIRPFIAGAVFAMLALLASLIITAVVLYLLFPAFSVRVSRSVGDEPWLSLLTGLAVFAGVPLLIVILFSSAIGVWLALILLALYLVMLLAGYFAGALFIANAGLGMLHRDEAGRAVRAAALSIAMTALAIVNLVPLLGSLLNWAVLLAGLGALSRQLYESRVGPSQV
jgi:cytoskeletal protein CcmA (bactofilin family)